MIIHNCPRWQKTTWFCAERCSDKMALQKPLNFFAWEFHWPTNTSLTWNVWHCKNKNGKLCAASPAMQSGKAINAPCMKQKDKVLKPQHALFGEGNWGDHQMVQILLICRKNLHSASMKDKNSIFFFGFICNDCDYLWFKKPLNLFVIVCGTNQRKSHQSKFWVT